MPKIAVEIQNCKQCPFLKESRVYTGDSWETVHDWHCTKKDDKKIQGYIDWYEEKNVPIPDWCPSKID